VPLRRDGKWTMQNLDADTLTEARRGGPGQHPAKRVVGQRRKRPDQTNALTLGLSRPTFAALGSAAC
jgi:hypothetical protein